MNIPNPTRITAIVIVVVCYLSLRPPSVSAIEIDLERPGEREFVRDLAGMLDEATKRRIQEKCDRLLSEKATPIIVITIDSMAARGAPGLRIETFATLLFDQWGIGQATINGQDWNTGILLLISQDDRKARIELGGGWGRREDALCREIMDDHIIPEFKRGDFAAGIEAGVDGLDIMARKLELPSAPTPVSHYFIGALVVGLIIFTVVSLARRGQSGWAFVFWAAVFSVIGAILYALASSSGSSSGGSYSGGSFGGGSSGGGGATGSW